MQIMMALISLLLRNNFSTIFSHQLLIFVFKQGPEFHLEKPSPDNQSQMYHNLAKADKNVALHIPGRNIFTWDGLHIFNFRMLKCADLDQTT